MTYNFTDRVRENAYYRYLNRVRFNLDGNSLTDWLEAEIDEKVNDRIREEAYLHAMTDGKSEIDNWNTAKNEIYDRIKFLAFYLHEANIDKPALENWFDAQKLYIQKF